MNIGKKIAYLRKEMEWTQAELAEKLFVTDKAVSKWEQGAGCPELNTVVDLANVFGVSTDYLLKDENTDFTPLKKADNAENDVVKVGESIIARTHAEFLNILLDKNFKGYMKCGFYFNSNTLLWMIRLNNQVTSTGWCNSLEEDGNKIVENFVGSPAQRLEPHKNPVYHQTRYVFDIVESSLGKRNYIFKGVFEFSREEGNNDYHVWKKVADTANFKEML